MSSAVAAEPFESVDDNTNEDDGMMRVLGIWFDMPFVLVPKESAVGIPVLGSLDKSTGPFGHERLDGDDVGHLNGHVYGPESTI